MKLTILITGMLSILLISCDTDASSEIEEIVLSPAQEQGIVASITYVPHYTAIAVVNLPAIEIDMSAANGMIPEVFLGDTLSYQFYTNGLKNGPMYELYHQNYFGKEEGMPTGNYKNGKKHGLFYRYWGYSELHYVAYYENDELIWADRYRQMELWPKMPFMLKKDNCYIEAKHPNGNIWFKGEFRKGNPFGKHKYYYADGRKRGEIDYNKNQLVQYWYYNGKKESDKYDFERSDWDPDYY